MKRLLKYLLCTAAGVVLCSRAAAIQPDEFLIQHFEPASPSFDITITAIFQDSRGLMWFGTNGGLFRYDGYDLSPVAYPSARPGFKRVRSICEDKNGDIWFGTNGGLFRYHHITARTEVFRPKDPGFSIVSKVISLSCGKIAFTARNYGAWLLDPSTGEYSRIAIPGTQEDETLAMCQGDAGMLYFLSAEKGLFRLDPGRSTTATPLFIPKKNPFEGIVLYNIEYYDYRIIAGMAERTYIIDLRNENIEERDWSVVNAVCKRVGGGFFAATNRGLLEVDANLHVIRRWTEDFSDNYALHDKSIKALCVDREGNLWAGTSYAGLYFLAKNHSGMRRYYPSDSMPASAMRIKEIVEDENGIMWLGSENGGLLRFDPSSGRTTRIPLPIGTSNILGLCVDGPWLWIGSYSRKDPTLRLDRRTLQARPMPNLPNCVYYICKAEDGQLFLTDDHALFRYDSETDLLNWEEAVSPAGFQYVKVLPGKNGDLWMGGIGAIICRYRNGKITPLSDLVSDDSFSELLTLRNVSPKLVDSQSRLWVAVLNMGLYRIDFESNTIRCYDILSTSGISELYNLLEDREGMIWITSGNGLILLDPESGSTFSYDKKDGILSGNFKSSSGIIASDGNLYAGMLEGMIVFDPVKFRNYPCEMRAPVFTSFHLIRSTDSSSESDAEDFTVGLDRGEIILSSSQNAFTLGVSDMTYSIPRRSRLVYSVDGGNHWNDVENGKIEFSRLSPGQYTVQVRSMMNDGTLDKKESTLRIRIDPPLYLSAPFIVLYVLLLVILFIVVAAAVRSSSIRKAAAKAKLEAEIREAEHQKELWSSKVSFIKEVTHEIRNPLSLVKAPVESLLSRLGHSADATVVKEIHTVSRNADKLSSLLDSLMNVHGGSVYTKPGATDSAPPTSQTANAIPPSITVPGTLKSILVLEADIEIRDFLCSHLENDYNVVPAIDVASAEASLERAVPDIIICDIDSETTEMFAFCARLKAGDATAAIPLVIISDHATTESRIGALNRGAEGFFSKPFSLAELQGSIRTLLENRERVKDSLSKRPSSGTDNDFLEQVQKILKARMADENLSVDSLAEDACMSTSSLFKRLKASTGMSPGEYIAASRMKEAAFLLRNTALTIDDISIKVGFRSHSYFSTCFKNHFGMSPKKYREIAGTSSG